MKAHGFRTSFGRCNAFAHAVFLASSLVLLCGLSFGAVRGPAKGEREGAGLGTPSSSGQRDSGGRRRPASRPAAGRGGPAGGRLWEKG